MSEADKETAFYQALRNDEKEVFDSVQDLLKLQPRTDPHSTLDKIMDALMLYRILKIALRRLK